MNKKVLLVIGIGLMMLSLSGEVVIPVKPIASFMEDAVIEEVLYGEAYLKFDGYDGVNISTLWLQGGYPLNEKLELGAAFGFLNYNYDSKIFDDQSGLSDIRLSGKYNFYQQATTITGGGYITLPIGSEDVGQQNLNFGLWGSLRYPFSETTELISSLGLDFFESYNLQGEEEYDSFLTIKAGLIQILNEKITLIPELHFKSDHDYAVLSAGLDYQLIADGHLRGAFGIGLDDGAPDLSLQVGFLKKFGSY